MKKDKKWLEEKVREIARRVGDEHLYINIDTMLKLIDQLDEPEVLSQELPVIPKFVADYIPLAKKDITLEKVAYYVVTNNELLKWKKEYDWIRENFEAFVEAWLAYPNIEVEKEPLYYVLDKNEVPLLIKLVSDSSVKRANTYCTIKETNDSKFYQLTEQEIKDFDERFWVFAVPVEAVE